MHRACYRQYVELYMRRLTDTTDKLADTTLEELEDKLCVLNITIARSEAKIRVGRERPELVEPQPSKGGFISWLLGRSTSQEECDVVGRQAHSGLLHDLTEEEQQTLHNSISRLHGTPSLAPDGEALIEQKIYVIAKNVSVSLVEEQREVALASLTGLGFNYESRSAISYQKLSFKLDSFLIEGCSLENDLVSVVKPIEETYSRGYGFAFSCDYEVNPKPGLANHSLTTRLLPLEIVYNESAFSALQSFIDIPGVTSQSVKAAALNTSEELLSSTKASLMYALSRKTTYYLDIDIKSPYLVLPEHGSLQRGGNVLVIDMGGLQVNTETGGALDADDGATMSEIEEKLYDRINITIPQLQVLFSDSGDEWRALRASDDSVLHLLPRVRVNAFLANSIHPTYRELPQQKVDFRVTPVKINVSEKRITHLNEFWKNFPLPSSQCDQVDSLTPEENLQLENWIASYDMSLLSTIRRQLSVKTAPEDKTSELPTESRLSSALQQLLHKKSVDEISETSAELQLYFPSSDNSDDEVDSSVSPKRTHDLPGFDENVSPHNKIKILARIRIEEITFGISRSNYQTDRPYLMLKVSHSIAEIATMDYGCAIQVHFGSLHLVDKFHNGPDGEYLELISSPADQRVLTIHFRETDAKCPDFTTHFQSTERKLIFNVTTLNLVWHRGSIITLINFLKHSSSKFQMNVEVPEVKLNDPIPAHLLANPSSHPVPPGALKWSVAAYVSAISLKMCDTEVDVLEAKIAGLQTRYSFKANERKTFQISVENMVIDDRSDMTLYNRILEVEEDFAFDIKYEELSPTVADTYSSSSQNESALNKPESSLNFKVGKIQIVLLHKFLADLLRFVDPVSSKERPSAVPKHTLISNESLIDKIICKRVLHRWDIRAITVLIPQKSDSPSLLTINTGSLKVENMFTASKSENMLLELGPFQIGRSVLKLSEGIEMQEAIFEPAKFRCDIKRCRDSHNREMHAWDVKIQLGTVRINIGQRDLSVVLGVLSENKGEAQFEMAEVRSRAATPTIVVTDDTDENVRKLHAFLTSVDIYKKSTGNITLDSLVVTLYTDMDEQWSSPVRDAAAALARVDVGEVELRADMYSNSSLKAQLTVASCDVFDVRPESSNVAKRIFGQSIEYTASACDGVYISSPMLLDVSLSRTVNGDIAVEMTLEKTRMNLSANVCSSINKYIMGALPSPDAKRGLENPGFTEDSTMASVVLRPYQRPSSSEGSTSGYLSSVTSSVTSTTVSTFSILVKPVQILIHPDPEKFYSPVLLLYLELTIDYSHHPAYENWKIHTQDASVSSVIYSSKKQTPYRIIEPFEVTLTLNSKYPENEEKYDIHISKISVHLNSSTIGMTKKFVSDLTDAVHPQVVFPELRLPSADLENLWVPKALFANSINLDSDETTLNTKLVHFGRKDSTVLNLKPTNIEVFLEENVANKPVLMIESSVSSTVKDWSFSGLSKTVVQVQICCFNPEYSCWEPLLETNNKNEEEKPFEIIINTEKCAGKPIGVSKSVSKTDDRVDTTAQSVRSQRTASFAQSSDSSSDSDDQCDSEMVILRAPRQRKQKNTSSFRVRQYSRALSGRTSDSDSEDAVIHQLSSAFTHLFSSDSEEADSSEDCSSPDLDPPEEESRDNEVLQDTPPPPPPHEGRGFSEEEEEDGFYNSDDKIMDSVDGGPAAQVHMSTCIMLLAAQPLELTLTPRMVRCCTQLMTQYTEDCLDAPAPTAPIAAGLTAPSNMHILNDVGPQSSVTLFVATQDDPRGDNVRWRPVRVMHYGEWSTPSSPASLSRPLSRDDLGSSEDQLAVLDWDAVELDLDPQPSDPQPGPGQQYAPKPQFITDYIELFRRLSKYKIKVSVPGFEPLVAYVGSRSRTRLFQLRPVDPARTSCPFFLTVDNNNADTHVTVSSPLKVVNTSCMPINLCFRKSSLAHCILEDKSHLPPIASPSNPFETHPSLTTLQPDEEYTVPLLVAYHSALYLQPAASEYSVSREGAWWQDAKTSSRSLMISCTKTQDQIPMTFAVALEKGKWLRSLQQDEALAYSNVADYTLKIQAPVVVHNHLPYTLELRHPHLSQPRALDPGSASSFHHFDPESRLTLQLQVNNYLGKDWKGNLVVSSEKASDIRSVSLTDTEVGRKMELLARCVSCPAFAIFIHTPYWIVNKTGLTLYVQGAKKAEYRSESQDQILLYKYKQNSATKMRVREEESDWSRHWNPDAVGTDGVVFCPDRKRDKKYRICVTSEMAALSASICSADGPLVKSTCREHLTTLVTLSPYFMVRNLTNRHLRFMEDNDKMDLWHDLEPRQCRAFWPEKDKQFMVAQHKDGKMRSLAFHYNSEHKTVLRTEKGKALVVRVGRLSSQEPMVVSFEPYSCGDAPVRIENWCDDLVLRVRQLTHQVTLVQQRQSLLYTWDDPSADRQLFWSPYDEKRKEFKALIKKSGSGSELITIQTTRNMPQTSRDKPKLRPAGATKTTFRQSSSSSDEGDHPSASKLSEQDFQKETVRVHWVSYMDGLQRVLLFSQKPRLAAISRALEEQASLEFVASLGHVGFSLITEKKEELCYLSLQSSPAEWEVMVAGKFKSVPSLELATWLEYQYQNCKDPCAYIQGSLQVNFATMTLEKPFLARLRRQQSPAVWLHYRGSQHYSGLSVTCYKLQVDNQLLGAHYPTVLCSAPAPSVSQPCLSLRTLMHYPASGPPTLRHLSLLGTEFILKLDGDFYLRAWQLYSELMPLQPPCLRTQLKLMHTPLVFQYVQSGPESTSQFDVLVERACVAGLSVNFSYFPATHFSYSADQDPSWLCSLPASLLELKDVKLSIGQYHRENRSLNDTIHEFLNVSYSQLMQQKLVLALGLDILGNPYQRLRSLTEGVCDIIYDPDQGLLEDPDVYEWRVARRVRRMLCLVVGGVGGLAESSVAVVRAFNNVVAKAALNPQDQMERHLRVNAGERRVHSVEWKRVDGTLALSVLTASSSSSPQQRPGMRNDSLRGFFSGAGRGIHSLISKPALGVLDSAAFALDAVRRALSMGVEVSVQHRLPRHLVEHSSVQAYSEHSAQGRTLLLSLCSGAFALTDTYCTHRILTPLERFSVAIVSNKKVFLVERCSATTIGELSWRVCLKELASNPTITGDCLNLSVRATTAAFQNRTIKSPDHETLVHLRTCIETLIVMEMEDHPCPDTMLIEDNQ
ncbi:Vacuolar protein sorting-associated protein 13 SHR-binding domain [Trinorchestia longiramus]|nr:Vacuolar protein sorting-associated protein 13 SHR-binding domain [Trinorchestia longiramus]